MDTHNPVTLIQFVSDVCNLIPTPIKLKVKTDLIDSRLFWKQAFVHAIKLPPAYNGSNQNGLSLIVDTRALVCISPKREAFIVYQNSKAKMKDLSTTNTVSGEGVISWRVRDTTGKIVNVDLPGYHIPNAEVRLLSPQVLLSIVDSLSKAVQTGAD